MKQPTTNAKKLFRVRAICTNGFIIHEQDFCDIDGHSASESMIQELTTDELLNATHLEFCQLEPEEIKTPL